jgi:hypothetical protein
MLTASINSIQPVGRTLHAQTVQVSGLSIGRIYQGEILGLINSQTLAVNVSGVIFNIRPANGMKAGQILSLQYLGGVPNPTFLLVSNDLSAPSVNKIEISDTSNLISKYQNDAKTRDQMLIMSEFDVPLIQTSVNASSIAKTLKTAIELSGLFYESHLADFKEGKRSLKDLLKEPQNQPDFDSSQVVAKQLDIFEKQSIQWGGAIWEGQHMDWEVGRDDPRAHTKDSGKSHSITTTLNLYLPNLKKVCANLKMQNGVLSIQISAESPSSEEILKDGSRTLASRIQDNGQKIGTFLIKKHESD